MAMKTWPFYFLRSQNISMLYVRDKEIKEVAEQWFDKMDKSNWNGIFQLHHYCKTYNPWNLISNLDLDSVEFEISHLDQNSTDPITYEMLQQLGDQIDQIQVRYTDDLYQEVYYSIFKGNNDLDEFYRFAKSYVDKKMAISRARERDYTSIRGYKEVLSKALLNQRQSMIDWIIQLYVNKLKPTTEKVNAGYYDQMLEMRAQAYKLLSKDC